MLAGGLYKHYRNHRRVSVVEASTPEVYSLACLRVVFLRGPFGSRRVTAVRFPSRATTICGRRVTAVSFPALDGGRSERAALPYPWSSTAVPIFVDHDSARTLEIMMSKFIHG